MDHDDGTRSEFRRDQRNRLVVKRRFDAAGELETTTVYRLGKGGKVLSGRVLDARGEDLYECRYGYSTADGRLVEEQVHLAGPVAAMTTGVKPEVAFRVLYSGDAGGQVKSQLITVGSSEDDQVGLPLDRGPGFDGIGKPKGIPSAPFEIPWAQP